MTETTPIARISPAVQFLTTASDSMPAGVGDRLYSATMNDFMRAAITCGMIFDRGDAEALKRLSFRRTVGVFDPFSEFFYTLGCKEGGTYPALWEKNADTKPWKAALRYDDKKPGRIAPGIALLIKAEDEPADKELARTREFQIWRCTSIKGDRIILGRYRHANRWVHGEAPARRKTLTREGWDALQKAQVDSPATAVAA